MKICLVSQEYPPETAGGIGTQTHLKAHGLARRGHAVHVISSTYAGAGRVERDGEVTVHRVLHPACESAFSEPSVHWVGYSWAVAKKLYELLGAVKFDLIEFPEYAAEGFIYQLDAHRYRHVPILVMLHGSLRMFAERIGWPEAGSELAEFGGFMEEAVVARADKLLAASGNIAEFWARRRGIPREEIDVLHTAVDAELFAPAPRRGPARPTVLFVGRVDGAKGVLAVADAVITLRAKYPEILFRVVGAGDAENEGRLREKIAARGAGESFELVGRVAHGELPAYYAGCDVFASPAPEEHGVASVYLEALASGRPVVACRSGGAPEAVLDGLNGRLVPPDDPEALAAALDQLLGSRALRERLGAGGRRLVEDYFARDRFIERVEKVYRQVISGWQERH